MRLFLMSENVGVCVCVCVCVCVYVCVYARACMGVFLCARTGGRMPVCVLVGVRGSDYVPFHTPFDCL